MNDDAATPSARVVLLARSPSIRRTPTWSSRRTCRCCRASTAGKTFASVRGLHHGDHHDLWIDPKNPNRMICANDGGVDITTDGGKSWFAPPLPISQCYHVSTRHADAVPRDGVPARPRQRQRAEPFAEGLRHRHRRLVPSRRRRGRLRVCRSERSEHRLRRRVWRHHDALRSPHRAGPQHHHQPVQPERHRPGEDEVSVPVDRADPDLAARPEDGLPRGQRAVPHPRRAGRRGRRCRRT